MDTVYLLVNGKRIERFESYSIDADMFAGAAAFELVLANPETSIVKGQDCELYVNDTLEHTGIIEKPNPVDDKNGSKLTITGRDYMGVIVDAHAQDFITVQDQTLKQLAELLIGRLPRIQRAAILYEEDTKGRIKGKGSKVGIFDTQNALSQIEPGMTVFEVLSQFAKNKGMIFYCLPHGSGATAYQPLFVFGKPREKGDPAFTLTRRMDGKGNNIKTSNLLNDITKRFSQVTVVGQKQGTNVFSATQINIEATVVDPDFPFYKPFFLKDEYGGDQPDQQARMALELMRHEGFLATYTVSGHSQNGKNWSINELANVKDEKNNYELDGSYLIYGRTFKKSKDQGTTTELRLGLPGMTA